MSRAIYKPSNSALEYAELACNLYLGCSHRCKYCYAPSVIRMKKNNYFADKVSPRDIIEQLKHDVYKIDKDNHIMISFIGDPYTMSTDNNEITRTALKILFENGCKVRILTKGDNELIARDIDLFYKYRKQLQFGVSLTFLTEKESLEWEPGASVPSHRLILLKHIKQNVQCKTFASFEPMTNQSIPLLEETLKNNSVDFYMFGRVTNFNIDRNSPFHVNFDLVMPQVKCLVNKTTKGYYIKESLKEYR